MRIGKRSICYFCGLPATTAEHVPALSFFPEDNEARGISLRKNLITVPSCSAHNNAKNEVDEKLRNMIGIILSRNSAGDANNQKIIGSLRMKGLDKFLAQCVPVTAVKGDRVVQTGAYVLTKEEQGELTYGLECIARGLWYWRHKECLSEKPSIVWMPDEDPISDPPDGWQGENPQVFKFNFTEIESRHLIVFKLYDAITIVAEITK